jgi:3-deoxy-D-manno-octulosonic-acid transferase
MLLYRFLSLLAHLLYAPWALLSSALGRRRMGDLAGRLGRAAYPDLAGGYWIHAVSVGEVGVAQTLISAVREADPGVAIGLSVTTAAGREMAQRRASVPVFAFPFDLEVPVRRALDGVRPGVLCLTETEIWPLAIARAHARGIAVALVNGRLSERSFPRYRAARRFFSGVLSKVSLFAMQSEEDARRVREIGAPADRVLVTGNLKFDIAPAGAFPDGARLARAASGRVVLVAASTAEAEEALVLEACRSLALRPFLALAPRRPERFDEVARICEAAGLRVLRRSAQPRENDGGPYDVYLVDSIGELAALYAECRLAIIGGSFLKRGGHNPIEAWAQGVPVLTGPHMENFREIAAEGEAAGILRRVPDAPALARAVEEWIGDPAGLADRGGRARALVEGGRGAARRTAQALARLRSGDARRLPG